MKRTKRETGQNIFRSCCTNIFSVGAVWHLMPLWLWDKSCVLVQVWFNAPKLNFRSTAKAERFIVTVLQKRIPMTVFTVVLQ